MDKIELLKSLGERIKEIRLAKGLTQTELAHKIGKDHPSINRLEKGKINPSYFFLCEIADGLEISINDIFESKI
ncbi:MAG: XRE family transcriptional regulator [Flavobacteriales bacterium]|nr:XRE family transcriptional regulator [Crocinitomicaceae bacterium]NBX81008.1 XRE family transcriptional regulator [Flavobacteriales bacterium]